MKCTRNPVAGNALASWDKKYFSKIDIDTGEGGLNMESEWERKKKKERKRKNEQERIDNYRQRKNKRDSYKKVFKSSEILFLFITKNISNSK